MRLIELTRSLQIRREKALVPFFTAGYPDEETFLRLLVAAAAAGCRVLEIGVPFSDPIADGPVIQASSQQALAGGMSLDRAIDLAHEASDRIDAGLVMMGYINPLLQYGLERFARRAHDAGVCGAIIPDVPLEESAGIRAALADHEITFIDLVAPTSSSERIARIAAEADGFLYLVAITGVTGSQAASGKEIATFVTRVREHTDLPLYVGFGVSNRDQAVRVAAHADGVIIGSALIRLMEAAPDTVAAVRLVEEFLQDITQSLNGSHGRREK